jgi:hypothetical protein
MYGHTHSYVTATAAGWFGEGVGFLAGKFSADIIFYALAIVGYEIR